MFCFLYALVSANWNNEEGHTFSFLDYLILVYFQWKTVFQRSPTDSSQVTP
ncbi:unnamed protein product [Porites lobata]|uniref:Uncharacterized protein n=1 Tax=Porites lobata TaxID=104759 RepID=A0ABN8SBB3_9CNID|nr:unnamed protein product [Porites lobata]